MNLEAEKEAFKYWLEMAENAESAADYAVVGYIGLYYGLGALLALPALILLAGIILAAAIIGILVIPIGKILSWIVKIRVDRDED